MILNYCNNTFHVDDDWSFEVTVILFFGMELPIAYIDQHDLQLYRTIIKKLAKKGNKMISIQRVTYEQKSILRNLLELYLYDFSEFDQEKDINSNGLYEYMKKYRKSKVGQTVANKLFDMFRGYWKVGQIEANIPSQIFWRKTIERYTNGNYLETREVDSNGPIQTFSSTFNLTKGEVLDDSIQKTGSDHG